MILNKKFLCCFIILVFLVLSINFISASGTEDKPETSGTVSLPDPLNSANPQELIGRIINAVLGIVGSIALAMFIYGGFTWMTSSGNMEKVQKGKDILIWAAIGLVVIFASYALVKFVIFTAIKGGV